MKTNRNPQCAAREMRCIYTDVKVAREAFVSLTSTVALTSASDVVHIASAQITDGRTGFRRPRHIRMARVEDARDRGRWYRGDAREVEVL